MSEKKWNGGPKHSSSDSSAFASHTDDLRVIHRGLIYNTMWTKFYPPKLMIILSKEIAYNMFKACKGKVWVVIGSTIGILLIINDTSGFTYNTLSFIDLLLSSTFLCYNLFEHI